MRPRVSAFLLSLVLAAPSAPAQEPQVAPAPVPAAAPSPAAPKPPQKKKGRPAREQKEAEGTQAADRFEAETVIKSRYTHDGQPLEVDPD